MVLGKIFNFNMNCWYNIHDLMEIKKGMIYKRFDKNGNDININDEGNVLYAIEDMKKEDDNRYSILCCPLSRCINGNSLNK